ncbi:hypothetical protein ACRARG_17225 [Pseudooceanicola sp. C21-150M6]|uniref:hypothetical protein n=1 Tax=Pseudooceanicola sp. C21-150M6 TaxID=3434355 RepID=UPI003D7FB398
MSKNSIILLLISAIIGITPAHADTPLTAPELGAASNFQVGAAPRKQRVVEEMGLDDLRDGLRWGDIEPAAGQLSFEQKSGQTILELARKGLLGSVTIHPSNPAFSQGNTATSPDEIREFAAYGAAVAQQLPDIRIEVANEFNGRGFVKGPARDMTPAGRAELLAQMLQALGAAGVPRDRVIGGAAHSIAAGFLWTVLDAGGADHMSALAIHPYTTAPEALPRQIEVLRRHPDAARLDIEITEIGTTATGRATDYLWRNYCQMALSDVRRVVWYPLELRQDGYAPLLDADLRPTETGRAFQRIRTDFMGQPVRAYNPDPFTYGCIFDDRTLVVWGAPRQVQVTDDTITASSGTGAPIEGDIRLHRDRVLVLERDAPPEQGTMEEVITLGPLSLQADSFDQFSFPTEPVATVPADQDAATGFERAFLRHGRTLPIRTCPGQDRPQAPWFPYLCSDDAARTVLHDRGFALGGTAQDPVTIRHRFVAPRDMQVDVAVVTDINPNSADGVTLSLVHNDTPRQSLRASGKEDHIFDSFAARAGDVIDILLEPGKTPKGDAGKFRISLYDRKDPGADQAIPED